MRFVRFFSLSLLFAVGGFGDLSFRDPIAFRTETHPQIIDEEILKKIDGVLLLINEFFEISHEIAKWKWNHKIPIEDKARESNVFHKMTEHAQSRGLPTQIVEEFAKAQIEASKLLQEQDFHKWREEGVSRFTDVRDFKKDLRPKIEAINENFLQQFESLLVLLRENNLTEVIHWRAERLIEAEGVTDFIRDLALQPLIMFSAEVSWR